MAKRTGHVILIGALLISARYGTCATDWSENLDYMINNFNRQVESFTQNLQSQIQETIQRSLAPSLEEARKTLENLPRDSQGQIISNTGGSTIFINNGNGVSKSIVSGYLPNGEPYVRNVEEQRQGNVIYHSEVKYNPKTNTSERICWTLDISKQGDTPKTC